MIYRLWARIRLRHMDEGRYALAQAYQYGGVKDRAALDAAWESALEAELEGRAGQGGSQALLLDLSKCYERIPLGRLAEAAVRQGWPRTVVAVAVAQYAAVRWVAVAGAIVPAGRAACGMVPGCALAVRLLGSFLHEPLSRALGPLGGMQALRTYVDDLRLDRAGAPAAVAAWLREALEGRQGRAGAGGHDAADQQESWAWVQRGAPGGVGQGSWRAWGQGPLGRRGPRC